jgi:hypothetical protein
VIERPGGVSAPYVAGDRAYGLGGRTVRLAGGVSSTLIATLSPAAVLDPTRRFLAYNCMRGQVPLLRLHDLKDEQGRAPRAWRALPRMAPRRRARLLQGPARRRRPRRPPAPARPCRRPGRPRVAPGPLDAAGGPVRGGRMGADPAACLPHRTREPVAGWPDLLALDGPGRIRVLGQRSALVAVSPDGRRAMVSLYGAEPPLVRLDGWWKGAHGPTTWWSPGPAPAWRCSGYRAAASRSTRCSNSTAPASRSGCSSPAQRRMGAGSSAGPSSSSRHASRCPTPLCWRATARLGAASRVGAYPAASDYGSSTTPAAPRAPARPSRHAAGAAPSAPETAGGPVILVTL